MNHLTPDELIDAVEDGRVLNASQHLEHCDECRRQLAELRYVLRDAKPISVPEPSPVFWTHFSQRINTAIDSESSVPGAAWPSWLRWQVLLPLGAVAMIILALMISIPKAELVVPIAQVAPVAPAALVAPADSWETVAELVGRLDLETASAAGVIEPGIADQAVVELTAEEQRELTRLLKDELTRAKS